MTSQALLCADMSRLAYYDEAPLKRTIKKMGYLDNTSTFKKFDNDGAQAFCLKINPQTLVIAFRGTEPDERSDIVADIKAWQHQSEVGGNVHVGFKHEVDKLYPQIIQWLEDRHISNSMNIMVTGHSLGAAMATICSARLHKADYSISLYTYGSPRVGDSVFKDLFKNIPTVRFVNNNDVVCKIPPYGFYTHVGELNYLDYHGNLHTSINWLQRFKDQVKSRIRAWQKLQFFSGVYDHDIGRYIKKIKNV